MRQLSADSITPSHTAAEASTPGGSHVSPITHKSSNESSKQRSTHPTQPAQSQQMQKQLGNLVSDINSLALDSNNSQQKASQQQSRPNQTASGNQNIDTSTSNTNGNSVQSTPPPPTPTNSNMAWPQTSPNAANGAVKTITTTENPAVSPSRSIAESTDTPRAIDVHQRPRRSRNSEDSSSRRSSRQSTSNAPAVSLVRSGAQFARPSLNLPHGYGKYSPPSTYAKCHISRY